MTAQSIAIKKRKIGKMNIQIKVLSDVHSSGFVATFNFTAQGVSGNAKGELDESKIREPESF
jgi:hypothetical protein